MERLGSRALHFSRTIPLEKDSNIGKEKRFEIPEDLLKKATHLR